MRKQEQKDILSHPLRERRIIRHRLGDQSRSRPIQHPADGRREEKLGRLGVWRRQREVYQIYRTANVCFETALLSEQPHMRLYSAFVHMHTWKCPD